MEISTVLLDFMQIFALLQQELKFVGVGVAAGAGTIGAGAGMGYLIGQTIASIHRQPEQFDQTRTLMGWSRRSLSILWSLPFLSLSFFRSVDIREREEESTYG